MEESRPQMPTGLAQLLAVRAPAGYERAALEVFHELRARWGRVVDYPLGTAAVWVDKGAERPLIAVYAHLDISKGHKRGPGSPRATAQTRPYCYHERGETCRIPPQRRDPANRGARI
jgi:hypothetical protein